MGTEVQKISEAGNNFLSLVASGVFQEQVRENSFPFKTLVMTRGMGITTPEGVDVPVGSFYIDGTELFDTQINFRPIAAPMKFISRAGKEDDYKVTNETVYFFNWSGERVDTSGGLDCGRVIGAKAKELSPEEAEENKSKATLYNHVYGLAYIKDADPVLVRLSLSGGKALRWSNASSRRVLNSDYQQRMFKLTLVLPKKDPLLSKVQQQAASNTYFNLLVEPDMNSILPLEPIAEEGATVLTYINNHNKSITEKHVAALKEVNTVSNDLDDGIIDVEFEEVEAELSKLN